MLSGDLVCGEDVLTSGGVAEIVGKSPTDEDDGLGSKVGRPRRRFLRAPLGPPTNKFGAGLVVEDLDLAPFSRA